MKISYDYSELITELKEELTDHTLKSDDFIQVLRDDRGVIVDWYYSEVVQADLYKPDIFDTLEEAAAMRKLKKQYEEDRPRLVSCRVSDILREMEEASRII